jgi:hypothetical protein
MLWCAAISPSFLNLMGYEAMWTFLGPLLLVHTAFTFVEAFVEKLQRTGMGSGAPLAGRGSGPGPPSTSRPQAANDSESRQELDNVDMMDFGHPASDGSVSGGAHVDASGSLSFQLIVDVSYFAVLGLRGKSVSAHAWVLYVLAKAMTDEGMQTLGKWAERYVRTVANCGSLHPP